MQPLICTWFGSDFGLHLKPAKDEKSWPLIEKILWPSLSFRAGLGWAHTSPVMIQVTAAWLLHNSWHPLLGVLARNSCQCGDTQRILPPFSSSLFSLPGCSCYPQTGGSLNRLRFLSEYQNQRCLAKLPSQLSFLMLLELHQQKILLYYYCFCNRFFYCVAHNKVCFRMPQNLWNAWLALHILGASLYLHKLIWKCVIPGLFLVKGL